MRIDIQARNFSLTDALCSHAERRLRFALYVSIVNLFTSLLHPLGFMNSEE